MLKPNLMYEGDVRSVVRSRALLADPRFASLWLSQGIAQTAQNALLFTLLVVVLQITGSSVHTSFLVLCFILPSIPLGFIVGVILDRVNKTPVLVVTNLLRAGGCVLFLFFHDSEWTIYAISMGVATAGLFFNPAIVALIPSLVPRDRLVPANSLYNFTLTGAQLVGIVFVAPTILKLVGADGMFITGAVLFTLAAGFAARVSVGPEKRDMKLPQGAMFGGIPTEFRESWRALTSDRRSLLALTQLITSSTLVLLFAILIPRYMEDVIGVPADSAALVFAPTGIGALVGLRFIPMLARNGKNRVVVIGLAGLGFCLMLLALVEPIADIWERSPDSIDRSQPAAARVAAASACYVLRRTDGLLLRAAKRTRPDRPPRTRPTGDARPDIRDAGGLRELHFASAANRRRRDDGHPESDAGASSAGGDCGRVGRGECGLGQSGRDGGERGPAAPGSGNLIDGGEIRGIDSN